MSANSSDGEKEWFYFIREAEDFQGETNSTVRTVGNGLGFWKSNGDEEVIYNEDGHVIAFKIRLTYFSGNPSKSPKKTHWKLVVYWLPKECYSSENCKVHIA